MKFTWSWLKKFLDTNLSIEEIGNKLTAIGLEVEKLEDKSKELEAFIVAEILEASPHPNADKLRVCRVNNGKEVLQIVCGASNARAGIKVALASVGTVVPSNNMLIRKSKIRDVESCGMLCSADELGLDIDSSGIIELLNEAVVGTNIASWLGIDNQVIEIAITPNRGDCLGVYGIARDLAASGAGTLIEPVVVEHQGAFSSPIQATITDSNLCSVFGGIYFRGVSNLSSPDWLKKELLAIGLQSISALVDITNYLCFSFGQPLHIYDADQLKGNIKVRKSFSGEKLSALNNKDYELLGNEIVIADDENVLGLAGIIGGIKSGCENNTKNIFLEIAVFDDIKIAQAGRVHQINSDARYRGERKLDIGAILKVANIASKMILDICGGEASQMLVVGSVLTQTNKISFPLNLVQKIGGVDISKVKIIDILTKLGFKIEEKIDSLDLVIPSWRHDVSIKEDIVEEILRINGYDNIPSLFFSKPLLYNKSNLPREYIYGKIIRQKLAELGCFETVSWSFTSPDKASVFDSIQEKLHLKNPISVDLSYMRPTILPNLMEAILRNNNRGIHNLSLFEIGPCFNSNLAQKQLIELALVRTGETTDKNIYQDSREFDFYDIKSDLMQIIEACGLNIEALQFSTDNIPSYYHPTKSATVSIGKTVIAQLGEIHPLVTKEFDLKKRVYAVQLFISNLLEFKTKSTRKANVMFSDFPEVVRDFAFIIPRDVEVGRIMKRVSSLQKNLIKQIQLFDLYQGDSISSDYKSIAFSVILQANDRTLVEQEIIDISQLIITEVQTTFQAKLRS